VWSSVAIYFAFVIAFVMGILILSWLFGPRRYRKEKFDTYECGVPYIKTARERYSVKFYLIAIFFILFDIEIAFLIPWAINLKKLGFTVFVEVLIFILILVAGLIYLWKKGALEWE
jgi:NADH-quinone oxidoreductase subunit A